MEKICDRETVGAHEICLTVMVCVAFLYCGFQFVKPTFDLGN